MEQFAVLDTETNWKNELMSLGAFLGESDGFSPVGGKYYVLEPQWQVGGMYDGVLDLAPRACTQYVSRETAIEGLRDFLQAHGVTKIFAYNARFDLGLLPELRDFSWYDIMRLAAYRQYNCRIPAHWPCCKTGRLKSHYGVEPMLRLLSGDPGYRETHNACLDARDELRIMALLGLPLSSYEAGRIL